MPNELSLGPGARTFAGARALFFFNGAIVGFASGCSGGEEYAFEAIEVIGDLRVKEHAITGYRVNFTAAVFRTIARGQVLNDRDAPGSLKEQNIFPKLVQALRVEGCDVAIVDEISQKTIWKLEQTKCVSYNWNLAARGVMAQNLTFVGVSAFDESEIKAVAVG